MDAIKILTVLGTPEGRADPYPLYAQLHELGQAVEIGPGQVMVIGYDANNSVLRDPASASPMSPASTRAIPRGGRTRCLSRPRTGS